MSRTIVQDRGSSPPHPSRGRTGTLVTGTPTAVSSRHARTVSYPPGHLLFGPGQGRGFVSIVRTGCVRLDKVLPDGRSIMLGLLGPNTIFAQEDGPDGLSSGTCAETMTASTISTVAIDALADLITESPDLAGAVVTGLSRRLTDLQTLIEQLLARDTSVRLATTLLTLAGAFGRPMPDGFVSIRYPLTHQALANMIGSNRVTVTRKLADLQRRHVVRSLGRNALAIDVAKLRAHAEVPTGAGRSATSAVTEESVAS